MGEDVLLICPMIDARRMEVFTASYDKHLLPVIEPRSLILDDTAFPELQNGRLIFTGNGREKLPNRIRSHPNALFPPLQATISGQADMANMLYQQAKFADLAYTEPFYLKPFHSTAT
jgi:tRNA threonylcarbamoyladenosine biosynthesis protein TsaB